MSSVERHKILGVCADGAELFYYPFAEVNFGGQIVSSSYRGAEDFRHERYEDDAEWGISVSGEEVAKGISDLIGEGLLLCRSVGTTGDSDFSVYEGYDCITFEQHYEKFGYGPHEFSTTDRGLIEMEKSEGRS